MTLTWVLTDGKAGDEAQALGVAEALGLDALVRRVGSRPLFALLAPWGPIDSAERPGEPHSPIAPPFPDLLVASGRRAVPYVRAVKRASAGRTFTVILKDPRTGLGAADLIWVPAHDRLRGPNVVVTATGPHRISAAKLAAARRDPDPGLSALPRPRVAVLAGGDSRHHRFREDDTRRLVEGLRDLATAGASLIPAVSRRTPTGLASALRELAPAGIGEPSFLAILAIADAIVATADSTNMLGEAAATGAPVLVFEPSGGHPKIRTHLEALVRHGAVRPFAGRLEAFAYEPLDATPAIADAVREGLARHMAGRHPR